MRILMVTPYAPIRDGIASYAVQQVKALRAEGHDVEVLSPQPSAAHHHLDLRSPRGPLALAKRVRAYDRVIIQFHPDVFYVDGASATQRARTTAGLLAVAGAARSLDVLVHEIDYAAARRHDPDAYLSRLFWRRVHRITVHTEAERARMEPAFGLPPGSVEVIDHGSHFVRRAHLDQAAARERLGIVSEGHVFLSIGFIQPHKGFDRAVRAMRALPAGAASLHVVGSVRVEEAHYLDHLDELRALVASTPGAHLHESYVSDEAFDVWLVAADTVVLPYRHIWSSSVLERAALYDRRVIATRVGGLAAQAPEGTVLVDTDEELAGAMADALGTGNSAVVRVAASTTSWSASSGQPDRAEVMRAVVDRATAERGRELLDAAGPTARSATIGRQRRRARAVGALERLEPLVLPPPTSVRPGVGLVKRLIASLTWWQMGPVVERINELQRATAEALADREPDR